MPRPLPSLDELISLLEQQRSLLIDVATGTGIQQVNNEYSARRRVLAPALLRLGVEDPFPWRDLWKWYGFYKDDYPTYQSRRDLVYERSDPVLHEFERRQQSGLEDWANPAASWSDLEHRLDGLKAEFDGAVTLDDLQDVGRRSREILIDAANVAFHDWMLPEGAEMPARNDAKRRIDYFLDQLALGDTNKDLRRVIRASYDLNNTVTHSGSITKANALAAAQATILVVRTLQAVGRVGAVLSLASRLSGGLKDTSAGLPAIGVRVDPGRGRISPAPLPAAGETVPRAEVTSLPLRFG